MRAQRKQELQEMMDREPNQDGDDLNDLHTEQFAQENYGCYNIKSSKDYQVPEHERMNTLTKQNEIILYETKLHNVKSIFNEKLLKLRARKQQIKKRILEINHRVRVIDDILNMESTIEELWEPSRDENEFPEHRFIVGHDEIGLHLEKYENPESQNCKRISQLLQNQEDNDSTTTTDQMSIILSILPSSSDIFTQNTTSMESTMPDKHVKSTRIEEEERKEQRIILTHEKESLLAEKRSIVLEFDESLYSLHKERFHLAPKFKAGEIRLMILVEELDILQGFETKECILNQKLEKCQTDQREVSILVSKVFFQKPQVI